MASNPKINQWNQEWRASPLYRQLLTQVGADPSRGPVRLSDQQRKMLQSSIEQSMGFKFPKGVEIDPAGNMNENEGFGKQAKKWGPIAGAGALAAFGIPGLMPGLLTGGGSGAAAGAAAKGGATAAGTLPSYGPSAAMQAANMGMGPIGGSLAAGGNLAAGAASAAGGLLPSYGPTAAMQTAGQTLPSAAMASPASLLGAAGPGIANVVRNVLDKGGADDPRGVWRSVLDNLLKYGPLALGGGAAIAGLANRGPTDAEKQMAEMLKLAHGRAQQTEPLFQMLNKMASSQMPKYTRQG